MPAGAGARDLVLRALAAGPATTSELYDRAGYPALMRERLIDYRAFRAVVGELEQERVIAGEPDPDADDGTVWRLA